MSLLIIRSTLIVLMYILLRRIFLKRLRKSSIYALGLIPAAGLIAILFMSPNEEFGEWCILGIVKNAAGLFRREIQPITSVRYRLNVNRFLRMNQITLFRIWVAGIAVVFLYQLITMSVFLIRSRKAEKVAGDSLFPNLKMRESEFVKTPCLLWNTVFLPTGMRSNKDLYIHAMRHENQHFRQGDPVWNLIRVGLTAVYWFHPLVWIACFLSQNDSEYACDEHVIRDEDEEQRKGYCTALLEAATGFRFVTDSGMGLIKMSGSKVYRRIQAIMNYKEKKHVTAFALLVLCVAMTVFGSVMLRVKWQESRKPSPTAQVIEIPLNNK